VLFPRSTEVDQFREETGSIIVKHKIAKGPPVRNRTCRPVQLCAADRTTPGAACAHGKVTAGAIVRDGRREYCGRIPVPNKPSRCVRLICIMGSPEGEAARP